MALERSALPDPRLLSTAAPPGPPGPGPSAFALLLGEAPLGCQDGARQPR